MSYRAYIAHKVHEMQEGETAFKPRFVSGFNPITYYRKFCGTVDL